MKNFIPVAALLSVGVLALSGCGHTPVDPVFDVPSLVGKDINGVQAILSTPSEDDSNKVWPNGDDEHLKTWSKQGVDLMVDYHLNTGKVVDFFVGTDDPSGATSDTQKLLEQGNLKENESAYRIEMTKAGGHPGQYTGLKAVPNG